MAGIPGTTGTLNLMDEGLGLAKPRRRGLEDQSRTPVMMLGTSPLAERVGVGRRGGGEEKAALGEG